jgi:hypothetical protein
MKMSDILRHVADRMDHEEDQTGEMDPAHSVPRLPDNPVTMVPPLQQKLEILKKAAGEPNAFDAKDSLTHLGEHDELDDIKRIAGLTVMIDGPQGEMG